MRKLILITLIFSVTSVFAGAHDKQTVFPRLLVFLNGFEVQIDNYTIDDFNCSGPIYITHQSGILTQEYYFGRVYARFNERRYYRNMRFNDYIRNANHNIFCYRI